MVMASEETQEFIDAISLKIKELREKSGLTQSKLARLIGVNQSLISRIEKTGNVDISLVNIFRIADALGMLTEIDFFCYEEEEEYEEE